MFVKSCVVFAICIIFLAPVGKADLLDLSEYGDLKKIYFIPEPMAKTVEVRLFIPVGEVDRTGPEGLAHYLEHLVVWSADKVHGEGFRSREMNAWTSPLWTAYWNRGPKGSFKNMIRNVRAIFEPIDLSEEFMLTERDVVEREFDFRYQGKPTAVLFREAFHHLYGKHGLGRSVMGTPESLRQISTQEALMFHQEHYSAKSSFLLIFGSVTKQEVIEQIEKHLQELPEPLVAARGYNEALPSPPKSGLILHLPSMERDKVLIVGQAIPPRGISRRRLWTSLLLLEDILNSSLKGGLSKPLYYDSFTVTQISAKLELLPTGNIGYEFFFSPEDDVSAVDALKQVQNVLNELAISGIPEKTLKIIRTRTQEQVRRLEKDEAIFHVTTAQQSILHLGQALDVKAYHYELGQPILSDLNKILSAIVENHYVTTAIAYPETSQ